MRNNITFIFIVVSYIYLTFLMSVFAKLYKRVERLETVFRQLGPTAEARLQESGTKVVLPPRWSDDEEMEHG